MTRYFTPSGVPVPPNPFHDAESPTDWDDPGFREALASPRLPQIINAALAEGEITEQQAKGLIRDLRQHKRALAGDRELPGELTGDPRLPHLPMPFAPRAEHPQDRDRGTPRYDLMRRAVENMDASILQRDLTNRMSENDPPHVHSTIRERAAAEPTLRESIEGAVDALGG